jgi:ABC-type antimicrobial peptide transport system permease subunit
MAYAVARRTGEIGLRIALGASSGDVVRLVVLDALRVVGIGLVFGAPLAVIGSQLLKSQLHGVSAHDPVSLASALVVLLATAVFAALVPARRASRVMPSVALAQE